MGWMDALMEGWMGWWVDDGWMNESTSSCIALLFSQGNPLSFVRLHTSLPKESLQKTKEVFQMYKTLMSNNDKPVSWNCEDEYANDDFPESTTAIHTQTSGNIDKQNSRNT